MKQELHQCNGIKRASREELFQVRQFPNERHLFTLSPVGWEGTSHAHIQKKRAPSSRGLDGGSRGLKAGLIHIPRLVWFLFLQWMVQSPLPPVPLFLELSWFLKSWILGYNYNLFLRWTVERGMHVRFLSSGSLTWKRLCLTGDRSTAVGRCKPPTMHLTTSPQSTVQLSLSVTCSRHVSCKLLLPSESIFS